MEYVDLGLSGLRVSRLCFGTGTNGWNQHSNQGDLGVERLSHLLRYGHERGVIFWDTADQYGTHRHLATALAEVPRESVVITTKTTSRTGPEVLHDVERFRRELGTDYIDLVLLHCLTRSAWPTELVAAMDALEEAKQRGWVRAVGVSCHDFGAFQSAADSVWVDVVLARINYATHSMDAAPHLVLPVIQSMTMAGKGVYGMKIVGGGSDLATDPERAIRYVLDNSTVHSIVIGMMNETQIDENVDLVGNAVGV